MIIEFDQNVKTSKFRVSTDSNESRVSNDDNVDRPVTDLDESVDVCTPMVQNHRNALSESRLGVYERDSMLSMFDEHTSSSKSRVTEAKQSFSHGYGIGDMVWGKVKSHPWWPGHIYDEAFAQASVRRLKRKGYVLVAFFGDSSYGWFDLDELVPFEPHFVEKSKQINAKTFLKAVEEAADEVSRRRGLGLACKCRNPFNFRPANVKGYFAVNVGNNGYAEFYSMDQIQKARDDIQARDVLAFMRELALTPKKDGRASLDFLKEKASVLAYRKAVYEQFDETYAQAFGQSSVQPSDESREALMLSVKAPLSGPLVIAETLGKKKTHTLSGKVHTNRNKYLFKRRKEPNKLKSQETGKATSSVLQPYVEVHAELVNGDYVLQRKVQPIPPDQQVPAEQVRIPEDSKPSALNGSIVKSLPSGRCSDPTRVGVSIPKRSQQSKSCSNHDRKLSAASKSVEGRCSIMKTEPGAMKTNDLKRFAGNLIVNRSVKRNRKKEPSMEISTNLMYKLGSTLKGGVSGVKISKNPVKLDIEPQKEDEREADSPLPISVGKTELKLVDLLSDLHSLAIDPFHGRERSSCELIRQTFLKFRSLVFQNGLALSPLCEVEPNENYDLKYLPGKSSDSISLSIKDQPSFKTPKPLFRADDPVKGGRKRGLSDRQEEIAAKRFKRVTEMKSLAVEKKAVRNGKDSVISRPLKSIRAEPAKKMEAPPKIRELTLLVIKFPPQSTLPSENELKARLARFGLLDHSRTRIFWKSFTCRVVFIYKVDAEVACRHLTENNTLFGSVRVRCHTRPLEVPGQSELETKAQREDGSVESRGEFKVLSAQSTVQIKSCLKKSVAGVTGSNPGGNGGSKGKARVKFVSGGGENSGQKKKLSRSNLSSSSFSDSSFATSSNTYGVDLNNKNFHQKVISQNPLSALNSPQVTSQFPNPTINVHYPQMTPTTMSNFNTVFGVPQAEPNSKTVDIAQEMITLMSRCNDVVINLKSSLGYVPYYSLRRE